MKKLLFVFPLIALLSSCDWFKSAKNDNPPTDQSQLPALASTPAFDSDSAYSYVKAQVDFGPRIPNSTAHDKCADWMVHQLKKWADTVYVQSYTVKAFDGL